MDRIASLFCTQALQVLCAVADKREGRRLTVPVRFILDDFAAAADTCIPHFDRITSVIRSREISVSIILQSLSQWIEREEQDMACWSGGEISFISSSKKLSGLSG